MSVRPFYGPQAERTFVKPIRTPGAVQGYGVLVAVEEDLETGNLVVRQVSEVSCFYMNVIIALTLSSRILQNS